MDNTVLANTTFVDLDYAAFPTLAAYEVPADKAIHVALTGSDTAGHGSSATPYRTLAKALGDATPGSTIVMRKGTYAEVCEDGDFRGVLIRTNNITVMAYPGEKVTVVPAQGANYGVVIEADNVVVRGIELKDFRDILIQLSKENMHNVVLADLDLSHSEEGISSPQGAVDGALICNVKMSDIGFIGLDCGSGRATNWRVEDVAISMSSASEDSGSGADAFAIEDGDNILLVNCDVSGASADGIDTKATRVVVYGCCVHDVGRNGIKLWHGGDVINTLVHHTGADASIVVDEGARTRLLHCTIAHHNYRNAESYNMTFGYDTDRVKRTEIVDSIVFNTSGGAYFNPKSDVVVSHSLFYNMENGRILEHGNRIVELSDGPKGLSAFGNGNLVQSPELDSRYRPRSGSPVIGAGISDTSDYPSSDRSGESRVLGNAPDLGPYEMN